MFLIKAVAVLLALIWTVISWLSGYRPKNKVSTHLSLSMT